MRLPGSEDSLTIGWAVSTDGRTDLKTSRLCQELAQYDWRTLIIGQNKKDGYRQQNVRQRQKLISIIDYNVCMTFY